VERMAALELVHAEHLARHRNVLLLARVSVKRRSTNLTSFSLIILSTSAGVVMRASPWWGRELRCIAKWQQEQQRELCHIRKRRKALWGRSIFPLKGACAR